MAVQMYNSVKKTKTIKEIDELTNKSNIIYKQLMKLIAEEADFEKVMEVRAQRNNVLIQIEILESRVNNIGRSLGITEQSIPKY